MKIRSLLTGLLKPETKKEFLRRKDRVQKNFVRSPKVMSIDETLDYILDKKRSVVRFGDAEMAIMRGFDVKYQNSDPVLRKRLREVLQTVDSKLFVCIPDTFDDLSVYTEKVKSFFESEMGRSRIEWCKLTIKGKTYGNAFISRPYIEYKDKSKSAEWFQKIKTIWKDLDITIVEGKSSRLGVGNDLFSGCRSIERIICPETFAFSRYEKILEAACRIEPNRLVLIALGPTAKLLVYDLCKRGYRAIDIGHVDVEYEWFLAGAVEKTAIRGKYVGEVAGGDNVSTVEDDRYHQSIVTVID